MSIVDIAAPKDFESIAALIHTAATTAASHCIHASTGESTSALVREMQTLHIAEEMAWAVLRKHDEAAAAMGAEFDPESGRAWLRGPFAGSDWDSTAPALWSKLQTALPDGITRFDSFLNVENLRGAAFYETVGFAPRIRVHIYRAESSNRPAPSRAGSDHPIQPMAARHHQAFARLHDAIFPNTYYTGSQIIGLQDERHRVWVRSEGNSVAGYIYTTDEEWGEEGLIEFLGVAETERGRGIGGSLLRTALAWLFEERGLPAVGLSVDDDNVNARGLYERVGFKHLYSGISHRLERSG